MRKSLLKRILIIGAGAAGKMVVDEIRNHHSIADKYIVEGFLDDSVCGEVAGFPVCGVIDSAKAVIEEKKIDEVIIAIPSAGKDTIEHIVSSLSSLSVKIKIVPGIFEIINGDFKFGEIRDINATDLLGREEVGFDIEDISTYYKDKSVFVTGGGGSIGSEILSQLISLPIKRVVAFGHGENSVYSLASRINDKRFTSVMGDIRDEEKMFREMSRFETDVVFHAAAHKHVPLMENAEDEAVKNNILGTYHAAIAAARQGVSRFILISTDKAVNPTSVMGSTKRVAEKIVLSLNNSTNTSYAFVRFGNVLGSRGSVVPLFIEQIKEGREITVTHPDITRYFMSIREAARLVIKAGSVSEGHIFVLDMGKSVKIKALAQNLLKLYGKTEDEIPIRYTGLRPGEKLYEEPLSKAENLHRSRFDKLLIAEEKESVLSEAQLNSLIKTFCKLAEKGDNSSIRDLLRDICEYKAVL